MLQLESKMGNARAMSSTPGVVELKDAELLEQLEEMIRQSGSELVGDDGEFRGGICRVEGRQIFILTMNPSANRAGREPHLAGCIEKYV